MAFYALSLATALTIPMLHKHDAIREVHILSTDPLLPAQCLSSTTADQHQPAMDFALAATNILDTYQRLQIKVSWVPSGKGLNALGRAKSAAASAAKAATYDADNLPPPLSKDQIRSDTRKEAINQWQAEWTAAPKRQPAYLALTEPPDGRHPPFVRGLSAHSRLVFSTGIRLLTSHAFTGEYTARFRPHSHDPTQCECGEPLQTAHHVIAACPCHAVARLNHILSIPNLPSMSLVFGSEKGGVALGAFIAASQACIRPRRRADSVEEREATPEDHG